VRPWFPDNSEYSAEGAKGVQSAGGTSRREAVAKMAEGLGGSLESFYFAFGETDAYVVLDLPNNQSAAAASIAVNTAGGATSEVVVLLTQGGNRLGGQALGRLSGVWILTDPPAG
jgi:uncharacterized protein with GYD domain